MPTSVHIPKPLLLAVDRRARALKISRNRFIVQALEREVKQGSDWSPEPGVEAAAEELRGIIQKNRRSKKPMRL
jgi:metal-responsive CopG/Arc/MetJ family transcriptional regulator